MKTPRIQILLGLICFAGAPLNWSALAAEKETDAALVEDLASSNPKLHDKAFNEIVEHRKKICELLTAKLQEGLVRRQKFMDDYKAGKIDDASYSDDLRHIDVSVGLYIDLLGEYRAAEAVPALVKALDF